MMTKKELKCPYFFSESHLCGRRLIIININEGDISRRAN